MQTRSHIFAAVSIAITSLATPASLRAQAAAGPIHPLHMDADSHAPAAIEEKPLPRHELWGNWTLNAAKSDDTRAKLEKARSSNGGSGRVWTIPGGRGGDRQSAAEHNRADDLIYPQNSFALAHNDTQVVLTDDEGRKRVYFTDKRKLQKSKDDKYKELAARWDGGRLVSEEKGPNIIKLTRSFEISPDGQHLHETLAVDLGAVSGFVLLRYVYDPAKPNAEDATVTKPTTGDVKP
jgi:hypothetical protein